MGNNKNITIAKNTIFLFIRTLVSIIVTLFTSRIFLNQLGVEDYGIYNLVGGVVSLFFVLTSFMTGATQRFLSVEIGKGDRQGLSKITNISIIIHLIIGALLLIIGEVVGLFLIYNYLNIPEGKEYITQFVFHFSLLSSIASIFSIPYNAYILAKERMSFFAIITIIDVLLKLFITASLVFVNEKLYVYSILIFFSNVIITYGYYLYCKLKIDLPKFRFFNLKENIEYKQMLSYSAWSFLGYFSSATREQGSSVVLNVFYGVALNATMGITNQVSGVFSRLFLNLQSAFRPQIMQNALTNRERYDELLSKCVFFSILLMGSICCPMIIGSKLILKIWLGIVPEYTSIFVQLMMIKIFFASITQCFTIPIEAYAKLKFSMIISAFISLTIIIISYFTLKAGGDPYWVIIMLILSELLYLISRLGYSLKYRLISFISIVNYCWKAFVLVSVFFIISFAVSNKISDYFDLIIGIISQIVLYIIFTLLVIKKNQRQFIITKIKKQLRLKS